MKKLIYIIILAGFILNSCQKVKEPGATSAVKVANEWWVTLDSVGISDYYGIGHVRIATYNTSANDNNIWIDDYENLSLFLPLSFKVKAAVDYTALTFSSAPLAANAYFDPNDPSSFPETVNITEGKIFSKMGHSRSGNVADSIHMRVEFSNDPGTMYEMNGVERTRFPEDDY
jgi:hypothetical protein